MNRRDGLRAYDPATCRATIALPVLTASSGGASITPAQRDELLARCAARQYVELDLDLVAYEQQPGVQNRNHVRFREGSLMSLGWSGKGTPFLRDHAQDSVEARGGTVITSATEKRGEGDYIIRQNVKLTAPWAVDAALRGLMTGISIGFNATGDVECSLCKASILDCSHWPGERYRAGDRGAFERDANGDLICELVYTAAELIETSAVNVPAVPSAQIDDIRALAAAGRAAVAASAPSASPRREPTVSTFASSVPSYVAPSPAPRTPDEVLALAERRGVISSRKSYLADALSGLARRDPATAARFVERDPTPIEQVELIIGQVPHANLDAIRCGLKKHAGCADPDALLCRVFAEKPRPRKPQALAVEARLTALGFDPVKIRRGLMQGFKRDADEVDRIIEKHVAKLLDDHYGPARGGR